MQFLSPLYVHGDDDNAQILSHVHIHGLQQYVHVYESQTLPQYSHYDHADTSYHDHDFHDLYLT